MKRAMLAGLIPSNTASDSLGDSQTVSFVIRWPAPDSARRVTMGQPIEITNLEHAAADLRRLASREKRGDVVRRLLALDIGRQFSD